MKRIIIANWKMNPGTLSVAKKLIAETKKIAKKSSADIVVCPPFPYMSLLVNSKKPLLGAQNVSSEKDGAYTGEVSSGMLASLGAKYVIIGHSERREIGETSELVSKKVVASLNSKLTPIVCIGEKERNSSAEHWQEIKWQLVDSLQGVTKNNIKNCIIAYEPVWAIGKKSSGPMSPDDVSESAIFIKKVLAEMFGGNMADKVRIIYGGSVDAKSVKDIINTKSVAGFLVGRASLSARDFEKIAVSCSQ